MNKILPIIAISALLITGCGTQSESSTGSDPVTNNTDSTNMAWQSFYDVNEDSFQKRVNVSFSVPVKSIQDFMTRLSELYQQEVIQLETLTQSLSTLSSGLSGEENEALTIGLSQIEDLISDLKGAILETQKLASDTSPKQNCGYIKDKKNENECNKLVASWLDYNKVNKYCALSYANVMFGAIEGFSYSGNSWLVSMKKLEGACFALPSSNRLFDYPRTVIASDQPQKIYNQLTKNDKNFAVQIADGIWTSYSEDLSALESSVYSSWVGYCGPYKKLELRFSEEQLILGQIKAGSCFN